RADAARGLCCAVRGRVLLRAGLGRDAPVVIPGFRDEADGGGLSLEQRREAWIVRSRTARPPRHAERGEGRLEAALLGEQLRVGQVRARITALDIVDAEIVQPTGDDELVVERKIDAVGLRAVA